MSTSASNDRIGQRSKPGNRFFYGWVVTFVSFLVFLFVMGPRGSFGNLVSVWANDFGWNLQQISLAASLNIFLYGFSQPFAGWLVNRFGARKVTIWGLVVYGISSLLLSFLNSLWHLYLLFGVLMGISWSFCSNVSLSTLLSRWFKRRRGLALSLGLSGTPMGQFLLIPLSMMLILNQGWRLAVAFLGLLVIVIALPLFWKLVRDNPEEMGLLPDGRTSELNSMLASPVLDNTASDSVTSQSRGLKYAMGTLPFWLLVGSFFICGWTAHLLMVHFVPAAIISGHHPLAAAKAAGVMGGASAVGGWIAGFLSDKMGRKIPMATLYLLRGLGLIIFISSATEPMLYISASLIGFGIFGTAALTAGMVADQYGVTTMGTILGIVAMGHQIGGGISTYVAGYIAQNNGSYYWAFLPAAFLLFAAFLACLLIRERRDQK